MKARHAFIRTLVLIVFSFGCCTLFAQSTTPDSSYIRRFKNNNVVEVYTGIYSTNFYFSSPGAGLAERKKDFRLAANSSAYIGSYFNYKWFSLNYSTAMPGTQLDRRIKLKLSSVRFRFGNRQMMFEPFYDNYNGLLIPRTNRHEGYDAFKNIHFKHIGLDYYYFTNSKKFSFRAANAFSEQQLKSAGGIVLSATPLWQQITWKTPSRTVIKDYSTYKLLASNPEWLMCTLIAGYSYNFCFGNGKWIIAPTAMAGGGLLKELHNSSAKFQPTSLLRAWVNAGYNGPQYYLYLNARWADVKTNLEIKNLHEVNTNIMLTGGFRFGNAKKRILGLM